MISVRKLESKRLLLRSEFSVHFFSFSCFLANVKPPRLTADKLELDTENAERIAVLERRIEEHKQCIERWRMLGEEALNKWQNMSDERDREMDDVLQREENSRVAFVNEKKELVARVSYVSCDCQI